MIESFLCVILIAAISAAFSYMLDFALGYPGKDDASEVNVRAALFGWSLFLAKRRLNQHGLLKTIDEPRFKKMPPDMI